jgi:hypothetical protein
MTLPFPYAAGIACARFDSGHVPIPTPMELTLVALAAGDGLHVLMHVLLIVRHRNLRLKIDSVGLVLISLKAGTFARKGLYPGFSITKAPPIMLCTGLILDGHYAAVLLFGHDALAV